MRKDEVENIVLDVIQDLGIDREKVNLADRLVSDLKLTSDDLSFVYVPNLQKRLGVKVPLEEWSNVETVGDTVELLSRALKRER